MTSHHLLLFVELAAKSTVVLGIAWAMTQLLGKRSAASRHLVWLAAFCILLAMPILMIVLPAKSIPILQDGSDIGSQHSLVKSDLSALQFSSKEPLTGSWSVQDGSLDHSDRHPQGAPRVDWLPIGLIAIAVWLGGVVILAIRNSWGLMVLHKVRRLAEPKANFRSARLDLDHLSKQIGLTRSWELHQCAGSKPPTAMTWGFMKPIVLVPQESKSWPQERLEAVLLHELAHVQRCDSVSQLIAVAGCTLYWINPAVWLCARAMRAEAETAADDTVLRLGVKPSAYAQVLLRLAADLGKRRQSYFPIGVPVMKKSKIESRVRAILDPSIRHRRGVTSLEALVTIGVAAVILMPMGIVRASSAPESQVDHSYLLPITVPKNVSVSIAPSGVIPHSSKVKTRSSDSLIETAGNTHRVAMNRTYGNPESSWTKQEQTNEASKAESKAKEQVEVKEQGAHERAEAYKLEELNQQMALQKRRAELERMKANVDLKRALIMRDKSRSIQRKSADPNSKILQTELDSILRAQTLSKLSAERQQLAKADAELQSAKAESLQRRSAGDQKMSAEIQAILHRTQRQTDKRIVEQLERAIAEVKVQNQKQDANRQLNDAIRRVQVTSQLQNAKIQMELAERMAKTTESLYRVGAIPSDQLSRAKEALRLAEVQLELARKILSNLGGK